MRLSDLIKATVVDRAGVEVGDVHDVQLIQDGPILGTWGAAFRVEALLVGSGTVATRLGLDRPEMRGPWLLKVLFSRRRRRLVVPWELVDRVDGDRILLNCERASIAD